MKRIACIAALVMAVMGTACGSDPCSSADGYLDDVGICLVNSNGQEISSEQVLNARLAAAIRLFDSWDGRNDASSREYFESKRTSIRFDDSAVQDGRQGTFWERGDGTQLIAIEEGMSESATYWTLSHEMTHALLLRWRGDSGQNHPHPYFDTSAEASGWDNRIFNCIWSAKAGEEDTDRCLP